MTTAEAIRHPRGAFAALGSRNYRIYLGGQSLANLGTWMQSIAQDWLIFTLTHSSTAVGLTMALQFGPILVLGLHTGAMADRLPKRRILLITQSLNAAATAVLAVITIAGSVRPADVYAFALLSGLIFAYDSPTRQAFVSEVAPVSRLRSAVAMNAAVFQATRLIGPALASLLIVNAGTGWVFAANAGLYLGPTIGLLRLRPADLIAAPAAAREAGVAGRKGTCGTRTPSYGGSCATSRLSSTAERLTGGLRTTVGYVRQRPDVLWTIFLVGMLGTFGLNFPIVLTAMAKSAFGGNATTYGLFNIVLAVGSAAGALLAGAAVRAKPRVIAASSAAFGLAQVGAAFAPDMAVFLTLLAAMGFVNLAFQAMANASVQLAVDAGMRGRVMGLYMLAFIGGTPIGAPIIGVLTNHFGARAGMVVCGAIPVLAVVITVAATRHHNQKIKRPLS